jgi:hypothetical protein
MKKFTEPLNAKITEAQKRFVEASGGSEFIRTLIDREMNKGNERSLEEQIEEIVKRLLPTLQTSQQYAIVRHATAETKRKADAMLNLQP